jgi:hypothetical protein
MTSRRFPGFPGRRHWLRTAIRSLRASAGQCRARSPSAVSRWMMARPIHTLSEATVFGGSAVLVGAIDGALWTSRCRTAGRRDRPWTGRRRRRGPGPIRCDRHPPSQVPLANNRLPRLTRGFFMGGRYHWTREDCLRTKTMFKVRYKNIGNKLHFSEDIQTFDEARQFACKMLKERHAKGVDIIDLERVWVYPHSDLVDWCAKRGYLKKT